MDKTETRNWKWLPAQMPGVARIMADKRAQLGDDHVNECWKRGVLKQEPGWFFAREGALMVGTPWPDDLITSEQWRLTNTQALVMMRDVEQQHGSN